MILEPVPQNLEDSSDPPNNNTSRIWRSCCLDVDKQVVMYVSQIAIGLGVLSFSFFQLIRADFTCDESSPYLGLVSFIIGTYVPRLSK